MNIRNSSYIKIFLKTILLCIFIIPLTSCAKADDDGVTINIVLPTQAGSSASPNPSPQDPSQIDPLDFTWDFIDVRCNPRGEIVEATIQLIISGGVEPYIITPKTPFVITKNSSINVVVKSSGVDGEPRKSKVVSLPSDTDECKSQVDQTSKKSPIPNDPSDDPPTDPPNDPPTDPPTEPPIVIDPPFRFQCDDGKDNDADGFVDLADPQCKNKPDDSESQ